MTEDDSLQVSDRSRLLNILVRRLQINVLTFFLFLLNDKRTNLSNINREKARLYEGIYDSKEKVKISIVLMGRTVK